MVPFSFSQAPLISRGMRKHSSTIEVWTLGAWHLELGAFALSCFRAFLILISVPFFFFRSPPRLRALAVNRPFVFIRVPVWLKSRIQRYTGFYSANSVVLSKNEKD